MTDFPACYVVPPGASLTIGDPGLKASQLSTGGALSVFETSIDAGPPLHVHDREDECSTCSTANCRSVAAAKRSRRPRQFVFLPRGRPHRFWAADQAGQALHHRRFGRH